MVYENMLGGEGGEDTLGELIAFTPVEDDGEFIDRVVEGVKRYVTEIDEIISLKLKDWRIERVARVDLALLRVAVYELRFDGGATPSSVVINEAVRIAQKYSTERSGAFVNGVLRAVSDETPA